MKLFLKLIPIPITMLIIAGILDERSRQEAIFCSCVFSFALAMAVAFDGLYEYSKNRVINKVKISELLKSGGNSDK